MHLIVIIYLIFKIVNTFVIADYTKLNNQFRFHSLSILIFMTLMYFSSHLLRVIRLYIIIDHENIKLRDMLKVQIFTNGVNLILPFRTGELFRIYKYNGLINNWLKTILVIFLERIIDVSIIFMIFIFFLLNSSYNLDQFVYILQFGLFFVISISGIYFLLPENISSVKLYVAKKYNVNKSIMLLRILDKLGKLLEEVKGLINKKFKTILFFSLLIWFFEICTFLFVFNLNSDFEVMLMLALFVFLAAFLPSGLTHLSGTALAFYQISNITDNAEIISHLEIYNIMIVLPALLISLLFFIFFRKLRSI